MTICIPHCFWVDHITTFTEIESDLVQLIQTQNTTITRSAVCCLCQLQKIKQESSFLEKILYRYYSQVATLRKKCFDTDKKILPQNMRILARALFVVGLLMKHFDFSSEQEENCGETSLEKFIKNCPDYVFQEFQFFYQISDPSIKDISLQGIGTLIQIPSVMQKATPILEDCLTSGSVQTKVSNLSSLADYFRETALSDDANGYDFFSYFFFFCSISFSFAPFLFLLLYFFHKLHLSSNLFLTYSVRNKIAQSFLPKILLLLFDPSTQVRQSSISLVEVYVRHGLLNPIDFLEPLLALCIVDLSNFSSALNVVKLIEFKKPQTHKRLVESLIKGCELFQTEEYWKNFNDAKKMFYGNFQIIFDLINQKKRTETLELLSNLLESEKVNCFSWKIL